MKTIVVCACAFALAGCVSMGGDPLLAAMRDPPVPVGCNPLTDEGLAPADPAAAEEDAPLCQAIDDAIITARGMRAGAVSLDHTQAGLGGVQIASAVATTGFAMFRAHPDNTLAATLIGGTALAARQGLKPQQIRDVLRGGVRALTCTAERGSVFLGAAERAGELRTLATASAARSLEFRRLLTAQNRSRHADAAAALTTALTNLDEAIASARAAIGPMLSAHAQVNDTRRLIERNIESQLHGVQPDFGAVVEAVGKLAPQPATQTSHQVGAGPEQRLLSQQIVGAMPDALTQATDLANQLTNLLKSETGPGQEEFAAIARCNTEL